MFVFAILTILYAYSLFFLGILHILYRGNVFVVTILYAAVLIVLLRKNIPFLRVSTVPKDTLLMVSLILFGFLMVINVIGVLGPETSFDALWYHLTFPKIYLMEHKIRFLPGGPLYYSAMPKLGELLFIPALAFSNEIAAKGIQWIFGVLTAVVTYKTARLYFSKPLSFLAALIFYSNIVVAWESTVAYIDLIRAFFEILAFYAFLLWYEKKKLTFLVLSAIMIGGALSTKLLALGSLGIFSVLILYIQWKQKYSFTKSVVHVFLFIGVSLCIVLPWLWFSYVSTGNPVYPFFTDIYSSHIEGSIFSLSALLGDFTKLFLFADDPISPLYLIVLPLLIIYYKKFPSAIKLIGIYALLALLIWYITPRTGGGRFILPYLPVFSLLVIAIVEQCRKLQAIYKTLLFCIVFTTLITIGYRGIAHVRYLPVVLGQESKDTYLSKHLNFNFGEFYDTDGYLRTHIKPTEIVLLYGFHNMYYVDVPFIHSSWIQKGDRFTYILTQDVSLPERFKDWEMVYENPITSVRLYKNGDKKWVY